MTFPAGADLIGELGEGARVGDVNVGVWFAAVAVATGGDGQAAGGGHADYRLIFCCRSEAVQLHRVQEWTKPADKTEDHSALRRGADAALVPKRVVYDSEHAGQCMEAGQDIREDGRIRPVSPERKQMHPVGRIGGGEIVNAKVEERGAAGDGPFNGNGGRDAEQLELLTGVDGVEVCEGNDGGEAELADWT